MKPEIKQKWLEALRSGKFEQARENLYVPAVNGYCCLGVLCEVAIAEGVEIKREDTYYGALDEEGNLTEDCSETNLPKIVAEWAGLDKHPELPERAYDSTKHGELLNDLRELFLAEINDAGVGFGIIADLIEEFL